MPSRPVLIGRGLVTQTLNKHYKVTAQNEQTLFASTSTQEPVPATPTHSTLN